MLVVVPEYLTSPIGHMALGALVANAPVSFGTGFLFPAATRWFVARGGSTSLTYALDPAGAVAAGVLVTVFLAAGVRLEGQHTHDWQRLFPGSHPGGSFTTPAATYLYGWPGGTFYIVSSGGVVDTLPEPGQSREIAALLLSQKPDARYVLLLGRVPLAVALALQELQPLASVTWCHDDPVYARTMIRLAGNLPPGTNQAGSAGLSLRRIRVPDVGPQVYVRDAAKGSGYFDVALVWPAALVSPGGAGLLGRVLLQQVRAALQPEGVVALPLGGGPGAWSPEQRRLAAAILMNADAVWPRNGWWCRVLVAGGWQGMHRARCAIRQRRCFILNN